MGDFKMGSKTVMSQSGTSNPTWGANAPTGCIVNVQQAVKLGAQTITSQSTEYETTPIKYHIR